MEELWRAAPKLKSQMILWMIYCLLWYVVCNIIALPLMIKFIKSLKKKKEYMELHQQNIKKGTGVDIGDGDDAIRIVASENTFLLQHMMSGLLSFWSGFEFTNLFSPGVAYALARHGNLCELGWETEDSLLRFYEIYRGGDYARKRNPLKHLIKGFLHHTASFCIVVPFNIYYPEYTEFHELSCLLEFSATIATLSQQYGYTLDTKNNSDLFKMKISVVVCFIVVLWSRGFKYVLIGWHIIRTLCLDENWFVFSLFCIPLVCLTIANASMVVNSTRKLLKFVPMSNAKVKKCS